MTDLSPAAKAVDRAIADCIQLLGEIAPSRQVAAAALRAAADQVVPLCNAPKIAIDAWRPTVQWHVWDVQRRARADLLAIANELEAMTDFRSQPAADGEVAELVDFLRRRPGGLGERAALHRAADILERLAAGPAVQSREPASVTTEPNDQDLDDLAEEHLCFDVGSRREYARAVLARWGNPAPQPISVSERLPEAGDCDAEGRCWWWHPSHPESGYQEGWMLRPGDWGTGHYDSDDCLAHTHWLPAHALPLPSGEVE
jgi:hypothetical protein